MNRKRIFTIASIVTFTILILFLSAIVGFLICGITGATIYSIWMRISGEFAHGDRGLGLFSLIVAVMGIFGLLGGALFAIVGHLLAARWLVNKYKKILSLGPHPVLKITLLTWGIIIAAVLLLKLIS